MWLQVDNDENKELKAKSERNKKGHEIILEFKNKILFLSFSSIELSGMWKQINFLINNLERWESPLFERILRLCMLLHEMGRSYFLYHMMELSSCTKANITTGLDDPPWKSEFHFIPFHNWLPFVVNKAKVLSLSSSNQFVRRWTNQVLYHHLHVTHGGLIKGRGANGAIE